MSRAVCTEETKRCSAIGVSGATGELGGGLGVLSTSGPLAGGMERRKRTWPNQDQIRRQTWACQRSRFLATWREEESTKRSQDQIRCQIQIARTDCFATECEASRHNQDQNRRQASSCRRSAPAGNKREKRIPRGKIRCQTRLSQRNSPIDIWMRNDCPYVLCRSGPIE